MDKDKLMDMALEKIIGELDDVEGRGAMSHTLEECPNPESCDMHDMELGKSLAPEDGHDGAVKIEISKLGPSMEGAANPDSLAEGKEEEGLSPEEAEELRKLLK